ncbi:hypothetical protein [Petroclostridium sp. X23]|uniref:hypothetical protein n=1 Tax=Petroclostridium sp. X23 TaxID=3045146 RepID=UPI0024ACFF55|nr:hypothetical protein [Petroclostridium sp. X23]WHH61230.1 hypothetical protein QKW49_11225 [Petroclostridium sp. X23]
MSKLANCIRCGNVYIYSTGSYNVCPQCKSKYDEVFSAIREYLIEHPNSSVMELASKFNISVKSIRSYIQDERLSIR